MSLKHLADELAARGRYGDTELVHMSKGEVAGLQALAQSAGGSLTINPDTGKPEAFFLAALLPTILGGVGASMGMGAMGTAALGAGVGALTNRDNPLMGAVMGGMGGFGGGQLAGALGAAGSAGTAMGSAIPQQATAELAAGNAAQQAAVQAASTAPGNQAAMLAAQNAGGPTAQMASFSGAPTSLAGYGHGIQALGSEAGRGAAMQSLGGAGGAMRAGMMAAAPMMMAPSSGGGMPEEEDMPEIPKYDFTAGLTGDYYQPGQGTFERRFFTDPTFTRRAAAGGIMQLAEGGSVDLKDPAQGMTGASSDAMRYLMGQTDVSPATMARRQSMADMEAARAQAAGSAQAAAEPEAQRMSIIEAMRNPKLLMRAAVTSPMAMPGFNRGSGFLGRSTGTATSTQESGAPRFSFDPMTQQYTRLAQGGLASLAKGGIKNGGFVVPADVVSMAGEGNTEAGYALIQRKLPGATPIKGKDGGQADTVKTSIEGKQPARVAHGEMYLPPEAVKKAGGAKKLYAMMDNIRKQATGSKKQIRPVNVDKALA